MSRTRIQCRTLFDITATGVRNHRRGDAMTEGQWQQARNQQRNWDTVNQIIALRTLPENISEPSRQGQYWLFEFDVLDISTLGSATNDLSELIADSKGVPMITGLTETYRKLSYLEPDVNIWFSVLSLNNARGNDNE